MTKPDCDRPSLRAEMTCIRKHLDTAGIILVALDTDGIIRSLNRKGHEVLEYPEGELVGKNWFETCLPARERATVLSVFRQLLSGDVQPVEHFENRVLTRSGRERLIAWHNTPLTDENGKCVGTLGSGEDITDRKRAEEALRESEERFRSIIETSPDAIAVIGLDGRFLMANHGTALLAGFDSVEDLLSSGKGGFDLLAPEDRQRASDNIRKVIERGVLRDVEYCAIRRDGSRLPTEISASLLRDPSGNPKALILAIRDITKRRQAEAALGQSEELYRSVVENIDAGIALVDANHTIVAVNPAQARILDKAVDDLIGKKCFREFEKRDRVCPHCQGAQAMATGRPAGRETEGVRDDGSRVSVQVRAFPLFGPDGAAMGFVELVEDITKRKQAKEMLQKAKEAAEAANRAKSEFLANMSHEIRTPLTAILGYADVLLDNPQPGEAREAAATVKRNGEHLLALINDILDISKIEAGKLGPEFSRCRPHQIVDEVVSLMRVRADAKGLQLAVEYHEPVPETIQTDPVRLRQILTNLVGNAVKFTELGSVRVVTRLVDQREHEPKLRFDVTDTGIGLAEHQIGAIFQPFTQVDGSMQRRFAGTGLGLAISKRLAELLGGDITVSSTPGKGSTFSVTVPTGPLEGVAVIARPPATPLAPRSPALDEIKLACRLLLAEDGPDNQRLISLVLRKAGAEVTVAENGQVAVDRALAAQREGRPFEVILMDIQMPVMNGYEATARLRQEGFRGPIIALTAHAMTEDRHKCLDAGCDDYLSKPVAPRELAKLVGVHLGKGKSPIGRAPRD